MTWQVFALPDLGEGLTEAELVRWLVDVGDTIAVDAPIAEVETAKATVEVPSPFGGVVARLHGTEGATLLVGAPLISVETAETGETAETAGPAETYVIPERAGSGNVLVGYGTSAASPPRRRRASGRPANRHAPTGVPGSASETATNRPAVRSPIVRQLALRAGVDLTTLVGTGPDGLITRADVVAAAEPGARPAHSGARESSHSGTRESSHSGAGEPGHTDRRTGLAVRERVPLTGVRRAVCETLTRSRAEIPEATTWVDVDATALLELRAQLARQASAPSVLAMVARFVVAGLGRFPRLNARVDLERGEIVHLDGVNLGIAAQTDRGLVVPAVRAAHRLGMQGLDAEIRRLISAARAGTATATDLSGGSFTVNNYGVFGVDGSVAIINHPEVAILGMGRILPRPWVVAGEVAVRQIVQLSLVFDHRVCDGGTAGGFLRFVADAIEAPMSALADL